MASRGPRIKEEYIDTFLESISVTPNTKKIVTIDSEKLKVKIKQELAELAHRVAHRANGPGYEYQEPIYQEIERRRRNMNMIQCPGSPVKETDFVQDDYFSHVFDRQGVASSVLQARKASQPNQQPPSRSSSANDLFRDKFINKIAQFQRARSQTPTPEEPGRQTSQISSTGIKCENNPPNTMGNRERFRNRLLRRTSSRSSGTGTSLSPVKKGGNERKDDINITVDCSTKNKDRNNRLAADRGGDNIKFPHTKSPTKHRPSAGSPRKSNDRYIPIYELDMDKLRLSSEDNECEVDGEDADEAVQGRPIRPRRGESLWDYIAAKY